MIYLSGAITHKNPKREEENRQRFYRKANELRMLGLQVYNPVDSETQGAPWEVCLAKDIDWIYQNRPDTFFVMKGWEQSRGTRLEIEVARRLNALIVFET